MKEYIDLHIHTLYSDGDKTPKQIIQMAKEIGLTTRETVERSRKLSVEKLLLDSMVRKS